MEWSARCATMAYLDALQLNTLSRKHRRNKSNKHTSKKCFNAISRIGLQQQGNNEFVSALAAGMKAKLIVEVTHRASPSTIALAAAARQTGGRLVCILPELVLNESEEVIRNSGLKEQVEFRTEDPSKILPYYENIGFSFVDCKVENSARLLNLLHLNPMRSVVVASNLVGNTEGLGGYVKRKDEKVAVRSLKHPIGKKVFFARMMKMIRGLGSETIVAEKSKKVVFVVKELNMLRMGIIKCMLGVD
ncbi:unnamed protein product [Sphenostylis stenocarpa]|uniref:Uncharacterized protein n=1 Tax=Sphenostylis stenocarpa TaxID=92480 RepID=A0AA86SZQ9_9FABA|nr:unnamed protein product [Sphenostylis stenocarpa]